MTRLPGAGPRRERIRHVTTALVLTALVLRQHPGQRFFDTKLDLAVNPIGFLERALHVWNPQAGFGQIQNQAFGYLFPMGPFFAAGHRLDLPSWLVQRGWQSLLLVGAYAGAVRLAGRLPVGTATTRWLAALAYALAPRVITTLGPLSAETLGPVLLPWVLLPLVGWQGRTSARGAASRSGLAVLVMGGANAAVTLAVLPLPALWLLASCRTSAGRRLTAWWAAAVSCACLWWLVPLVVMGRYSSPFLDYIETATNTTSSVTPFQTLRGATHWVAYFSRSGQPWWPAGWDLVALPWMIVTTSLVAALGLAGLAGRRMPARTPLLLSVALGFLLLSAGSSVSPVAGGWHALLDGPLSPLRNVHKFDPLVRLPLALGLAHALAAVRAGAGRTARPRGAAHHSGWLPVGAGPVATRGVAAVVLLAVVSPSWPLLAGHLDAGKGWSAIPSAWREAARYVAQADPRARSLLVPSSGFGEFVWGRTIDEPMQPLAEAPWAVRDQVPLGAVGSTRMADAVEQVLAAGRPSQGLAPVLARGGIRFLVVRNDLDWPRSGSPRPAVVHAVIDRSPGLTRLAAFGPIIGSGDGDPLRVLGDGLDVGYPQVEVYAVAGAVPVARAVPLSSVAVLSGGPESLLQALESGAVAAGEPTVLSGQRPAWVEGPAVLTDGLRRRDRNMGRVQGNLGVTLAADEPRRVLRHAPDLLPFDSAGHATVAVFAGADGVRASTSQGYADSTAPTRPEAGPFAAVDGRPETAWRSSHFGDPRGQWLEVQLPSAIDPTGLRATFVVDELVLGPRVTRVSVVTDTGARTTAVPPGGTASLAVPPGETRRIRVEIADVAGRSGDVGISELTIPGRRIQRSLLLPGDTTTRVRAVSMEDDTLARPVCLPVAAATRCDPSLARGTEDATALDRRFDLAVGGTYTLAGSVVARGSAAVAHYLDPLGGGVRASSSSVLADAVQVRASSAVDGDASTAWIASPVDPAPALQLSWGVPRRLESLSLTAAVSGASRPTLLRLESPAGTRDVDLSRGSQSRFAALVTDRLTVRVLAWDTTSSVDPATGFTTSLPPGIGELGIPALADLVYRPDLAARLGPECGFGPPVAVDGVALPTRLEGTVGDLLSGTRIPFQACGGLIQLAAGRHHLRLPTASALAPAAVTLLSGRSPTVPAGRSTQVLAWDPEHRRVSIGAGASALLVVPEGSNPGWQARLGSRVLLRTDVDGWQQAYLVPAGAGGVIELRYLPGTSHRVGLAAGAVAALVVVGSSAVPGRRRTAPQPQPPPSGRRLTYLTLGVPVLVGGWVGVLAVLLGVAAARGRTVAVTLAVAGPLVAAGVVAVQQARTDSLAAAGNGWVQLLVLAGFSAAVAHGSRRPGAQGAEERTTT